MKVILISEYNIYTTIGGTETYVDLLLKGLVKAGLEVVFITNGKQLQSAGIEKRTVDGATLYFLPQRSYSTSEIKQSLVSSTWPEIQQILLHEQPALVHVHTLSTFFNHRHLLLCKETGYPTFFTTHVSGHFCSRGDLIQNNEKPCDGKVGTKCSRCLFSKGFTAGFSGLIHGYYLRPLKLLKKMESSGIKLICVADWQRQHAALNGFPNKQISVIRQAISFSSFESVENGQSSANTFRVGFLGRFSPEKGSGFLLQLIEKMKEESQIKFVLGIPLDNSDPKEVKKLQDLQRNMPSIEILSGINATNKKEYFQQIDCLLIPSFCWETGPIVLLESLYYGKPVLAANIGGTAEYAYEFPAMVQTYQWGDIEEVKNKICDIKGWQIDQLVRSKIYNLLRDKEKEFVKRHLEVYELNLINN
jgi:glycosyltransferase involved in cell wall biosynthesis